MSIHDGQRNFSPHICYCRKGPYFGSPSFDHIWSYSFEEFWRDGSFDHISCDHDKSNTPGFEFVLTGAYGLLSSMFALSDGFISRKLLHLFVEMSPMAGHKEDRKSVV